MNGILIGTTAPSQSGTGSNDNDGCNIITNKREITSDATGVTAPTTSGGFGQ